LICHENSTCNYQLHDSLILYVEVSVKKTNFSHYNKITLCLIIIQTGKEFGSSTALKVFGSFVGASVFKLFFLIVRRRYSTALRFISSGSSPCSKQRISAIFAGGYQMLLYFTSSSSYGAKLNFFLRQLFEIPRKFAADFCADTHGTQSWTLAEEVSDINSGKVGECQMARLAVMANVSLIHTSYYFFKVKIHT